MLYIFDVDGTLLDTIDDIGRACNIVSNKHAFASFPINNYASLARYSFKNKIGGIMPGLRDAQKELLAEEAWLEYQNNMMDRTAPYAGIKEMLYALVNRAGWLYSPTNLMRW